MLGTPVSGPRLTPGNLLMEDLSLVGAAPSPAFAGEAREMAVRVEYGDINLASPEGQKQLNQRLEKAVRTVCRTHSHTGGSRILTLDARVCVSKARADARQQLAALNRVEQRGG